MRVTCIKSYEYYKGYCNGYGAGYEHYNGYYQAMVIRKLGYSKQHCYEYTVRLTMRTLGFRVEGAFGLRL